MSRVVTKEFEPTNFDPPEDAWTEEQCKAYMEQVAQQPCVICEAFGMQQLSRTQVHHCIHGRYSNVRRPAQMTIPICEGHHQGDFDTSKIALHREPEEWKRRYGEDTEWIAVTRDKIEAM